jgi:hypothetical protein
MSDAFGSGTIVQRTDAVFANRIVGYVEILAEATSIRPIDDGFQTRAVQIPHRRMKETGANTAVSLDDHGNPRRIANG